jgi:TrmH family RNA methyltransferase
VKINRNDIKFISSKNNELIVETAKLKDKKHRDKAGLFCVEGIKLFHEAVRATEYGWQILYIIAVEETANEILAYIEDNISGVENMPNDFFIVTGREVYKKISSEEAFQGVMCVIRKPPDGISLSYQTPVIILDEVRDAGNAGTIVRTANALCRCEFIFSCGCADLYNSKTLRAAMGANFYQKVKICENLNNLKFEVEKLKENGYNILAAHLDKNSKSIRDIKFTVKTAVVFGNEGKGITSDILKLCGGKIIIPINENSESLNVSAAASIVLWEMSRITGV